MLHSSKTGSEEPCFHVEDGSSIDVQETKNAFQRSLAHNAFSKQCIESNVYSFQLPCEMNPLSLTHMY